MGEGLVSTRAFYLPNIIDIENFEKGLVSDYWINKPLLFTREIIYPIISFKGQLPESCRVSTDFFTVNTTYKKIENKIVRRDQIKITQSILPNNMFKNKIFREQVQKAQDCTDPLVLVL